MRARLTADGISLRSDIRLNGGAASYVLGPSQARDFNDVDLIFRVDLSNPGDLQKIRNCVLGCLTHFLPGAAAREKVSSCSLKEAYVEKMVKVCNEHGDRWSLISLSHNTRKNVELKFVDKMKRQFEFSVDSFQIILDSLLTFYDISEASMTEHFYPTVVAESLYGNFSEAWHHLENKLIATRNPEEIRGGGLLKYCNLLVRGYRPASERDIRSMERYMCSRFFIDFSDINQQRQKLEAYLANHFNGDEDMKYEYLTTLYRVVDESTICLMGHERRQTLNLIHQLAYRVYMSPERKAQVRRVDQLDHLNSHVIDKVFYGAFDTNASGKHFYSYPTPSSSYHQVSNSALCPYYPPFLHCP